MKELELESQFVLEEEHPSFGMPSGAAKEAAFATSLLVGGDNPVSLYSQIASNLEISGQDPIHSELQQSVVLQGAHRREQALIEMFANPDISAEAKGAVIKADVKENPSLVEEVRMAKHAKRPEENENQREIKESEALLAVSLTQEYIDRQAIMQHFDESIAASNVSWGQAIADMLKLGVPGYTGSVYNGIVERLAEKYDDLSKENPLANSPFGFLGYVLPGEISEVWKDYFGKLSGEQRYEFIQDFREAVENELAQDSNFFGENDMFKWHIFLDMADEMRNDPEDFDLDRVLDNTFGVFDAFYLGRMLKGVIQMTGRAVGLMRTRAGVARLLNDAVDAEFTRILGAGLTQETLAKELGLSREELAALTVLPKADDSLAAAKTNAALVEILAAQLATRNVVSQYLSSPNLLSVADKAAQVQRILDNVTSYTGHHLHTNLSRALTEATEEAGTVTMRLVFGNDEKVGFSSAEKAFAAGGKYYQNTPLALYKKDPVDGLVRPLREGDSKTSGEFFYGVDSEFRYQPSAGSIEWEMTAPFGSATRYALPPTSIFDRKWTFSASQAGDRFRAMESRLMKDFLKHWKGQNLSRSDANRVLEIIEQEGKNSTRISNDDLAKYHGFTPQMIAAKQAIRGTFDTLYSISNTKLFSFLQSEGYSFYRHRGGKYTAPVKVLSDEEASSVKYAFDPDSGRVIEVDIKALEFEGKRLGRMFHDELGNNRHQSKYLLMDETEGVGKITELPPQVLDYHVGYYTRYYKDRTFIFEVAKNGKIDGRAADIRIPIGVAQNEKEARLAMEQLAKDNPKKTYEVEVEANLRSAEGGELLARQMDYTLDRRASQPIFGVRGAHLVDVTTGAPGRIYSPVESMQQAIKSVSHAVNFDDLLEGMKLNWERRFGHLVSDGKFPGTNRYIKKDKSTASTKISRQANAEWEYINFLSGNNQNRLIAWTKAWESLAGLFGSGRISSGLLRIGETDPTAIWRGLAFTMLIATAPFRQAWLQSQQFVGLFALDPLFMARPDKWMSQYAGFSTLMLLKNSPSLFKAATPVVAKAMGLSEKEVVTLVRGITENGLLASIDAHLIGNDAIKMLVSDVTDSMAKKAATEVANTMTAPLRIAKKIGFDFGEYNNIIMSYIMAIRLAKKANPRRKFVTPRDASEIAGRARELSLTIIPEGAALYQKGWLSPMFQFFQIQHKTLALMLGGIPGVVGKKVGNKSFTQQEAFRYAIGQLFFYGMSGWGLGELVLAAGDRYGLWAYFQDKYGSEKATEIESAIVGGATDYVVGKLLAGTELSVSSSLAPASGIFSRSVGNLFLEVALGSKALPELAAGPGLHVASRIRDGIIGVKDIWSMNKKLDTKEYLQILQRTVETTSFGSRYMRMRLGMMLQNPMYINSRGEELLPTTAEALKASGYLGLNERDWDEYRAIHYDVAAKKREASKVAGEMVERFRSQINLIKSTTHPTMWQDSLTEWMRTEWYWLGMVEMEDFSNLVKESLQERILKDGRSDPMAKLLSDVGELILDDPSPEAQVILNRVKRLKPDDEDVLRLQQFLNDMENDDG